MRFVGSEKCAGNCQTDRPKMPAVLFWMLAAAQSPMRTIRLKVPPDAPLDAVQYTSSAVSAEELASVAPTFEGMPSDPYLASVSRSRRFGKYLLRDLRHTELPIALEYKGNVFMQSGSYNDLVRDGKMALVRQYTEHAPAFFSSAGVQRILQHCARSMASMGAEPDVAWELGLHALRLTAPGEVTPEGVHRDGYHYVLSTVVARHGVVGGHSLVHAGKQARPLLEVPMAAGDSLLVDDRAVFHSVSNVSCAPGFARGHRDVVVVTARPWPTNAAGGLVDDVADAQLGLLEGAREVPDPGAGEAGGGRGFLALLRAKVGRTLASA